ncbi:alpha/beta hydrolase-fold protein [Streptomyces sp. NBC_01619]|uniref:Alpha/beta hydrolase-fold protein n=1 Tax=Streptomyces pratisoli TaxID=3139917 RepID=A0ACC6QLH4_9ACTN|nr:MULTISPECIES: alpha/beta hydrolase-fold protein [unclassified Streptomyces]MCX4512729.1 alpha/beta hydrolase-fold protein [Streptomyces sp. NBC_01619]
MSLTGTPFFVTAIVLAVVAVLLPLALWSRVRGPAVVRGVTRLLMVGFAQATALVVVFVAVNNSNGLYDSWDDLLGTGDHVTAATDLGKDGMGGVRLADLPRSRSVFKPATDPVLGEGVRVTNLSGQVSGVEGEVYVWLPPQYDEPAYRNTKFPVVELLPGYPGSAKAWFGTLKVQEQLRPMMESGEIAPFILVAPRTTLLGRVDTGCANIPGRINADTWLSVDVRKMVTDTFRATQRPEGWAVAGYSAGGHCAAKLAVAHPDRYRAGVSLSGYNDPAAEKASLAALDEELRRANDPLHLLRSAPTPPRTSLFVSGARGDGFESGLALRAAAKPPTLVDVVEIGGAHDTGEWKRQVPDVFFWLTRHLAYERGTTPSASAGH